MNYVCDHCEKQFVGHKRNGRWRFCNRDCLTAARKSGGVIALSRQQIRTKQCVLPSCGKIFTYLPRHKKKIYCDTKCAGIARRAGGAIAEKVDTTTFKNHGVN